MTDLQFKEFEHMLAVLALATPRLFVAFSIVPFLGGKYVNGLLRNAIILSLMLVLYPLVAGTMPDTTPQGFELAALLLKEVLLGLLMGFVAGIIFWAVQSAGFLIDNSRGASMANVFDPLAGESTSVMGSLFFQMATVLFFATGGFLSFLMVLFKSYAVWPVTSPIPQPGPELPAFFLMQVDLVMRYVLLLAAPVVISSFLIDLAMGFINRFAPQLNVFFLAMPIKSGVASLVIVLYLATLFTFFEDRFLDIEQTIKFLQEVVR